MKFHQKHDHFRTLVANFLTNKSGATAVEYALIVTVLSLAIIGGVGITFDAIEWLFADNNSQINQAMSGS